MRLQNGFQNLQPLRPVKIRALLRHHLQPRITIHHTVKSFRAIPRIVVAHSAKQFHVTPLLAHLLHKILRRARRNRNNYLTRFASPAALVALISRSMQKTGTPAALALRTLATEPSASVRVEQHRLDSPDGNKILKMRRFLCRIILRIKNRRFATQFHRAIPRRVRQHHEPRIVQRRNDNRDFLRLARCGGGWRRGRPLSAAGPSGPASRLQAARLDQQRSQLHLSSQR